MPGDLPPQPRGVPWPTHAWTLGPPPAAGVTAAVDRLLAQPPDLGTTLAIVVVHRGRIVAEGYEPGSDASTALISWSTAKSMTHAVAGLLVGDGLLDLDAPAAVPEWQRPGDPRRAITLQQLLEMRAGLRFAEDYVDAGVSDVIEMLFGTGQHDVAAFAAGFPLDHPPGIAWSYSSGTTNIVSRALGDVVGGGEAGMRAFLHDRLFGPLGMASADPRFDAAGTFSGSSFVYCTARDFARFGYVYLRDGVWDGRRVLPAGWVDHARRGVPVPPDEDFGYGAHWWLWREYPGSFAAHGYEGQYLLVVPDRDLVLVRLGKTPAELRPNLVAELLRLVDAVPVV
jgi:CubicO group peptidase (beta-lactamase class C family)